MRASRIEFRLRMAINAAIIALGFWAPWIGERGPAAVFTERITLLEYLALHLARTGLLPFTVCAAVLIVISALLAALGALLRVAGTAYLGTGTVTSMDMRAGSVVEDGPYRYMRNPLYVGLWCMVAAMAFIMPVTGAVFAVVLMTVFLLRLILAEEAFLSGRIGEPYVLYLRAVPRLLPRLHPAIESSGGRPHWIRAMLAELTPIGAFVALAFLSWSYDSRLMIRAILISFGASLIVRAIMPQTPRAASAAD